MKKTKFTIAAIILFTGVSCVFATQKIVSFKSDTESFERIKSIENLGGKIIREFHIIDAIVAIFPDNINNESITNISIICKNE